MPLDDIEQLLQERMGLHSSTVGSGTILHAVEQRMRDCGITAITDYRQILLHSDTELDALIDTVIIPETWFFRDINPFNMLTEWLRNEWLPQQSGHTLRILSVPCSSGEEAYTLAMCLADAGISPRNAHIDAIDISHANIEKAHEGEYGRNSFRGNRLEYRDRHFQRCGGRYRINDSIREYVDFRQANLLDNRFVVDREPYHVIFCRNLLIYFNRATQDTAIDRLQGLLTSDGLLFLGHSETGLLLGRNFTALPGQRCFGFRSGKTPGNVYTSDEQPGGNTPKRRHTRRHNNQSTDQPTLRPFSDVVEVTGDVPAGDGNERHDERLKQAFRLADEGHLGEAAEHCESLLAEQTEQAGAYFLLGLIRESAGNLYEAEQLLRKAVYLDPLHHEALIHLGMVCEQRGDPANASRFRERAARAESRVLTGATE